MATSTSRTSIRVEQPAPLLDVARAAAASLTQCADFLATLPDPAYTTPCPALMHSTIGQHVRHCLDHYTACFAALEGREIDYDHRDRGTPVETCRDTARRVVSDVLDRLAELTPEALARPARVRVMLTADGALASLDSTAARELAFATHHAVHHHAMMAAIAGTLGLTPPAGFGTAPSTLQDQARRPGAR